jgi:hypothetical protein
METDSANLASWCLGGPTTLHGYDHDSVYMLVRADTDDPELQRNVALVGAWDLEGERYARTIAAVPKLLAACQVVVERWQHGNLAEAARMCAEAVQQATNDAIKFLFLAAHHHQTLSLRSPWPGFSNGPGVGLAAFRCLPK